MKSFYYFLIICLALQVPLSYAAVESVHLHNNEISNSESLNSSPEVPAKENLTAVNNIPADSAKKNISHKVAEFFKKFKNKLPYYLSAENQTNIVTLLGSLEIINRLWFTIKVLMTTQPLTDVNRSLKGIFTDLGITSTHNIYTSKPLGLSAAAAAYGDIIIGQELLDTVSKEELKFVLGHEITHLNQYHHIKMMAFIYLLLFGSPVIHKSINKSVNYLQEKYHLDNTTKMGKLVIACGKLNTFIFSNPLVLYVLFKLLTGKLNRILEKEADLGAFAKINSAQGGIKFFERVNEISPSGSILKWLNPFYLVRRINHLPWFSSHPSIEERIAYLKEWQNA